MSRPNSRKHSGNKIEIKIELTYAFSNRIPVWESGRSVMDQKFIAGIGNLYADEILFQARILPYRKAKD